MKVIFFFHHLNDGIVVFLDFKFYNRKEETCLVL